jgi:hypothetical protein
MTNNNLRDCCQTPEYAIHDQRCPIIVGPHARSHVAHTGDGNRNITSTVYCMCGSGFTADDERDARAAHTRHAVDHTNSEPVCGHGNPPDNCGQTLAPRCQPTTDVFDATTPPGVTQLPAVTTSMTPAQFKEWLAADGTLFMVILPANRTFVIKVPTAHHEFFVAMMQQVRFALGPEVQAVRMNMVTAPGADVDAATGKADDAPQWAQPAPPTEHLITSPNDCPICDTAPGEHCLDPDGSALRDVNGASTIHPARNMAARPAAEQENPPPCWEQRTPGTVCAFHKGRRAGRHDCWNLRDANGGEHLDPTMPGGDRK